MANDTPRLIQGLLEAAATEHGYELVLVETAGGRGNLIVRVYLDHDGGITIEQIALANKWIAAVLDALPEYSGGYDLEVSSPGIERPLAKLADFVRFTGSEAKVSTTHEIDGCKNFTGTIRAVDGTDVVIDVEGETVRIPFAEIKKARLQVQIDFSKEGTDDDGI